MSKSWESKVQKELHKNKKVTSSKSLERNFPKELNVACGRESNEISKKVRPRTLENDCNEIKVDCANDAPNLCEGTSNKLNPEAEGPKKPLLEDLPREIVIPGAQQQQRAGS